MHHFLKLTTCLLLIGQVALAQKTSGLIYRAISEVGQDLTSDTPINGIEYAFSTPIYNYNANLANNSLLVELRNTINHHKNGLTMEYY